MADITSAPDRNVHKLTAPEPISNTRELKVTWQLTDWGTSSDNSARVQGYDTVWQVYWLLNGALQQCEFSQYLEGASTHDSTFNPSGFYDNAGVGHPRTYWYPFTQNMLRAVVANVRTANAHGRYPSYVKSEITYDKPEPPEVGEISQNPSTGVVSVSVTSYDGRKSARESYDTVATTTVIDSRNSSTSPKSKSTIYFLAGESRTLTHDVENRMGLSYDQWVLVRMEAYSRGYQGDSDKVTRDLYVSWPSKPSISRLETDGSSRVTVRINTGNDAHHPTTGVRLERLRDVTYESASDIPPNAQWEQVGATDNGQCTALTVSVSDVYPSTGKITWLRVKAWNQDESIFSRYSEPWRVRELERVAPTASDDGIVIASVTPGTDGKSAEVLVAWNADGSDDSTGTELSWSPNLNAWRSNDAPDTYTFTFDDGQVTVGGTTYQSSAKAYLYDLEEGTKYYVKARRYLVDEDHETTYGDYYGPAEVQPVTSPSSVTLVAPMFVPTGSDAQLWWTFDSSAEQKKWEVITGTVTTDSSGRSSITGGFKVLMSGDDALGSCVLPWETIGSRMSSNTLPVAVSVSTGGASTTSEACILHIAAKPGNVQFESSDVTVQAQPFALSLTCDTAARLAIAVTSRGSSGMSEAGIEEQAPGDSVWSDVITPTWTRASGSWSATVTAPTGLDLRDGALYDVAIVATDPLTGLSSGTSRATLRIAWSRKATEPTGVTVYARHDVSTDGTSDIWASMTLPQASGLAAADLLDVWRVTADGSERIAHRVAGGSTIIDHYAPYGGSPAYRVVRVTADGDAAWFEYPYQLSAQVLRIDFGSDYVELPYNLKLGSGWGKDFEARQHLDGSVDGYWNRAVRRTATLGSAVVRADGSETAALRRLAAYAGPCFVRNPDGEAFEANVEVSGLDRVHNDGSVTVSMSVEGVSLTDDYKATINT